MKEGCSLNRIRINNVRSLKDTGMITLPQITVLVGENSSGKSTFLRTFPLIKQSICKRTDGPLLWAGDVDDYVDFGSFSETVTNDHSETIGFTFEFPLIYRDEFQYSWELPGLNDAKNKIVYSITIAQSKNREYVSNLLVRINDTDISFDFDPELSNASVAVDGYPIDLPEIDPEKNTPYYYYRTTIPCVFGFPFPNIAELESQLIRRFLTRVAREASELISHSMMWRYALIAVRNIGCFLCQGESISDIVRTYSRLSRPSNADTNDKEIYRIVRQISKFTADEQEAIIRTIKLIFAYACLPQIDQFLDTYFRRVHYIAPLRATAERYYRLRNLAIDEVDYQGKNLAIFLNGLPTARLKNFQKWTKEHFGFFVLTETGGGHLSVKIALREPGMAINLSDTGFGYSQILPIIIQLWDLSTRKQIGSLKNVPLVVAIEQPELHLHPAIQAKLTDVFIASIKLAQENGYTLQLLLETHSQTIVNRFGRAIAKRKLDPNNISVVLFDKSLDSNQTAVRISHYNKEGYLQDWPLGFFAP